ncbi:MAG: universal stress protein [Candidatus Verstraetearchaeota archaeon]|nr:universal stress protein [Candidatus Verstraetearchaeota archaeon]
MILIFKNILVPIDSSPASLRALDLAIEFAMRDGAKITLIYVILSSSKLNAQTIDELKKFGENVLHEAEEKCEKYGIIPRKVLKIGELDQSSIASEIYDEVLKGKYDLVILGTKGYCGEKAILMGSIAIALAITLPCTVIIVR